MKTKAEPIKQDDAQKYAFMRPLTDEEMMLVSGGCKGCTSPTVPGVY